MLAPGESTLGRPPIRAEIVLSASLEGRFPQVAAGLRILTRAVEGDLDGLFFAFTMANLAGRVLAYACGSEAQTVALIDNLINGLVRERAEAAA